MNHWNGIEEFIQVVNSRNFSKAAEVLQVSKSHISQQISRLEERLGVQLLHRTTRKINLTDLGEEYYKGCLKIYNELESLESKVATLQIEPQGILRINSSARGPLGEHYFALAFAEFISRYPRLTMDIRFTKSSHVENDDFDLGIGFKPNDPSIIARKIMEVEYYVCCSPQYLKEHHPPQTPEDLKQHNCLVTLSDIWKFQKDKQNVEIKVHGNWYANSSTSNILLACRGFGIVRTPEYSALEKIKTGQLVPILEDWKCISIPIWVFHPHKRYVPAKVRLLIDFLIDYFNPPPWKV